MPNRTYWVSVVLVSLASLILWSTRRAPGGAQRDWVTPAGTAVVLTGCGLFGDFGALPAELRIFAEYVVPGAALVLLVSSVVLLFCSGGMHRGASRRFGESDEGDR